MPRYRPGHVAGTRVFPGFGVGRVRARPMYRRFGAVRRGRFTNRLRLPGATSRATVSRQVKPEIKRKDVFSAATVVPDTGFVYPLTVVAVGTGDTQRVGDHVTPIEGNSLVIHTLSQFAAGATPACTIRHMVVRCKQTSTVGGAGSPDAASLLAVPASPITSPISEAGLRNFSVLLDKKMTLSSANSLENHLDFGIPNTTGINYTSTDGTVVYNGALYYLAFSTILAAGGPPTVEMQASFQYSDS